MLLSQFSQKQKGGKSCMNVITDCENRLFFCNVSTVPLLQRMILWQTWWTALPLVPILQARTLLKPHLPGNVAWFPGALPSAHTSTIESGTLIKEWLKIWESQSINKADLFCAKNGRNSFPHRGRALAAQDGLLPAAKKKKKDMWPTAHGFHCTFESIKYRNSSHHSQDIHL